MCRAAVIFTKLASCCLTRGSVRLPIPRIRGLFGVARYAQICKALGDMPLRQQIPSIRDGAARCGRLSGISLGIIKARGLFCICAVVIAGQTS